MPCLRPSSIRTCRAPALPNRGPIAAAARVRLLSRSKPPYQSCFSAPRAVEPQHSESKLANENGGDGGGSGQAAASDVARAPAAAGASKTWRQSARSPREEPRVGRLQRRPPPTASNSSRPRAACSSSLNRELGGRGRCMYLKRRGEHASVAWFRRSGRGRGHQQVKCMATVSRRGRDNRGWRDLTQKQPD